MKVHIRFVIVKLRNKDTDEAVLAPGRLISVSAAETRTSSWAKRDPNPNPNLPKS